jgi:hypothetical protein
MRVVHAPARKDVAILRVCDESDDTFAFLPQERSVVTPGSLLSFTSRRAGIVQGVMRVVERCRNGWIAEPQGTIRPVAGDSGAPVCTTDRGALVGVVSGGIGAGVLQPRIVIERVSAADVRRARRAARSVRRGPPTI